MGRIPLPTRADIRKFRSKLDLEVDYECERKLKYKNGQRSVTAFRKVCNKSLTDFTNWIGWINNYSCSDREFIRNEISDLRHRISTRRMKIKEHYGIGMSIIFDRNDRIQF